MKALDAADLVRDRLGEVIFQRVAGPQGPRHRQSINAPGERWFGDDRPIRQVHGDSAMFIGGLTALLLQSLHPLAMAAVAGHSGYRGDPWGRLQRTSYFLAVTTFGRADDAREAVARVRAIHQRIAGTAPDGRPYAASDPHLLTWVHIAEADSFLRAHARFGAQPLEAVARPPHTVLAAAAVSLLPGWARRPLRLPRLPVTEATVVRPAGHALVHAIRWALTRPPPTPIS